MIYPKTSWLLGLGLLAGALGACAGKLDKPERFAAAVKKYERGGGGASGSRSAPDASTTDAEIVSAKDAGPGAPPDCVLQIFKDTCGVAGCHAKGSAQLDLVSAGVTDRLVDQTSDTDMCKGHTYIATDGSASLLLNKLSSSPACGAEMPLGGKLGATNTQCLTDWINSITGAAADAGNESGAADDNDAGGGQ